MPFKLQEKENLPRVVGICKYDSFDYVLTKTNPSPNQIVKIGETLLVLSQNPHYFQEKTKQTYIMLKSS